MAPDPTALSDVRVVELADLANAFCGKLLAGMGAEVILVETRQGSPARWIQEPEGFFAHYNAGKSSVVLDMEAEPEALSRLLRRADIFIDATPARFDHRRLRTLYPQLITVDITAFATEGPQRDYLGSDLVCQAAGGMVYLNGEAAAPPLQGAGLQSYHAASVHAAIAILLALLQRRQDGCGQRIDISVRDCVRACIEHATVLYQEQGTVARRQGSLHWTGHFRIAACIDGWVLLSTLGDWTTLIEWMKADGRATDLGGDEWAELEYRREHAEHLFDVMDRWAAGYRVAELVAGAQLRRLPFAAVQTTRDLHTNPQLLARGVIVPREAGRTPTLGRNKRASSLPIAAPWLFSRTPWRLAPPAPTLGQQNTEVQELMDRVAGPAIHRAATREATALAPLHGVRVIDFTWVIAGPTATRMLADYGADVIKIERLPAPGSGARSGLQNALNRSKRSIAINMDDARGIALARRLIATADVVVDNFSPRVMENWELTHRSLCRLRADIITVNMTAFGQTGPWRDHVGYGPTLQALAGFDWRMRREGTSRPVGWGFSYSDMATGYMAAFATLCALWHRSRSGEGQHIDLSQFESLISLLGPLALHTPAADEVATAPRDPAIDNRSQEMPSAPHGVYRCADHSQSPIDRWCAIAIFSEDQWQRFCATTGHPQWTEDPRWQSAADRRRHRVALDAQIQTWARQQRAEDLVANLQAQSIAAAVVADARDLLQDDGNSAAMRLSTMMPAGAQKAPRIGEHTETVLTSLLGMSAIEIAELRNSGVIT